ncbi:PREDICTED: uncharacterized protein LOC104586589 [Nelumbo nucifera]|uniref:Uncharacterized protein LOC104586589 n=1 Tax=Nelumbo nucifera TaxID=4432 RepID=A0A1U7YSW6_NELNU|nr:PREDICTED: uncharacterized protein LOC104586589 [Nelumbo nucifera]
MAVGAHRATFGRESKIRSILEANGGDVYKEVGTVEEELFIHRVKNFPVKEVWSKSIPQNIQALCWKVFLEKVEYSLGCSKPLQPKLSKVVSKKWKGYVEISKSSSYVEIRVWNEVAHSFEKKERKVEWKPPGLNKVKLNFDGSSVGIPGLAGIGGVIRDSSSKVLSMHSGPLGEGDSLKAELLALLKGLKLSKQADLKNLEIEGDSKIVISWTNSRGNAPWIYKHPLREIVSLAKELNASFTWIRRSANGIADSLAKQGVHKQQLFWALL